jgi:hypothetical protein
VTEPSVSNFQRQLVVIEHLAFAGVFDEHATRLTGEKIASIGM